MNVILIFKICTKFINVLIPDGFVIQICIKMKLCLCCMEPISYETIKLDSATSLNTIMQLSNLTHHVMGGVQEIKMMSLDRIYIFYDCAQCFN